MGKMNKMGKKIVALAGQPNCGKSTVFNSLTGARQFVANYPGVTVDKMMGWYRRDGESVEVVDLPGTYSLTSYSPEERVSRGVLLGEPLSAVVNVIGCREPQAQPVPDNSASGDGNPPRA